MARSGARAWRRRAGGGPRAGTHRVSLAPGPHQDQDSLGASWSPCAVGGEGVTSEQTPAHETLA